MVLICLKLNPLHPSMFGAYSSVGIVQVEKKTFKFCQCIFTILFVISEYLSLQRDVILHWTNLNPLHLRMLVPSLAEIDHGVLENRNF